jgi:hypothetical protein
MHIESAFKACRIAHRSCVDKHRQRFFWMVQTQAGTIPPALMDFYSILLFGEPGVQYVVPRAVGRLPDS